MPIFQKPDTQGREGAQTYRYLLGEVQGRAPEPSLVRRRNKKSANLIAT